MMSTTVTEEKAQSEAMKRAVQRLEDLRGYCRIYKREYDENEIRYALDLIEDCITETINDLAFGQE